MSGQLSTISAMKNILLSGRNIRILVILIAMITIIFIVWHYEQSLTIRQSIIASLQKQLSAQQHTNQNLSANLARAEERWQMTESELQDLIDKDLETRFEQSREENDLLRKEISELQYYHETEIARLERARNFLAKEFDSLNEYRKQVTGLHHQLEQNIAGLTKEIDQYKKTIAGLESENKQNKKLIASLKKPVETKPQPEPDTARSVTTRPTDSEDDKSDNYRHVRIQSLINAMKNQDSVARKNILVSVVPTIPDGVSAGEFLSLVSGMESEDILTAIQLTGKYITRPLDSQIISTLTGKMNAKDAEAANLIFNSNE